jgi:hypothetical protein
MLFLYRLPKEKRHKLILIAVLAAFTICAGIGVSFSAWQDFRALGTNPISLTLEQAVPSR